MAKPSAEESLSLPAALADFTLVEEVTYPNGGASLFYERASTALIVDYNICARANAFRIETNIDLSKVRINGKEYVNADLEKTIRVSSRNELVVDVLSEYFSEGEAGRRQGIVFCVNVRHAEEMERLLNASGIPAKAIHGKSRHPEEIMRDFREGRNRGA